jgi:hypothetical protein
MFLTNVVVQNKTNNLFPTHIFNVCYTQDNYIKGVLRVHYRTRSLLTEKEQKKKRERDFIDFRVH